MEGISLFVYFEPTLNTHMSMVKEYSNNDYVLFYLHETIIFAFCSSIKLGHFSCLAALATDHPGRPNTIHVTTNPPSRSSGPKDPARARHARGRTRLPALLVVLRWRRGGGGLPSVWYQSAPSPRARRWRTGGLQVRGLRPAPWRRVHRYVRAPSRRRNEQPKSTASPTTRPRRGWMVSAFASRRGRTPRAALYMVGGVAGGAGRRKVA